MNILLTRILRNKKARWSRKFMVLAFLVGLLGLVSRPATAQSLTTEIDQLTVDIWPDYDRAQVLVLITGILPGDAALPATITIPLPEGADLNAVARIGEGGSMFADIEYDDTVQGELTFTIPDQSFRIEYYMPYSADGNDRSFTFNWRSDAAIENFIASIQQPSLANEITITPEPETTTSGSDGLRYHELPRQSLSPGEAFDLAVSYTLLRPELSSEVLIPQEVPLVGSGSEVGADLDAGDGLDWRIVAGAAAVIVAAAAIGYFILTSQSSRRRTTKPRPVRSSRRPRSTAKSATRFCHECGNPIDAGDRFCSSCGAAQKK